jgi:hemolysin activation/secretion protein
LFDRDQLDVTTTLQFASPDTGPFGQVDLLYEHVRTGTAGSIRGERLARADPAGLIDVDLLTPRLTLGLDRTGAGPRTHRGTEVLLRLDYTHDLNAARFRYGRYVLELRQYLPVGFFPNSRRLALRGRLEQTEPLFGGTAVPFYQRPGLGGQNLVRGFRSNRFQGDGSLVLNAEYRYPIWSNWDALVFVDSGQVFPELGDVAVDRFHWSYGGGIHMLNQNGLSFRFEVAGSTEGVRTILTVEPTFRRIAR